MTTVKFKNKTYNLAEMDKASLLDLKLKIDFEANRVQTNITEVKADAYKNGIYANPEWFKNATLARKILAKNSQKIQGEFSKRKAIRRRAGSKEQTAFFGIFNDICKHRLDKELYTSIADEAREIMNRTYSYEEEE